MQLEARIPVNPKSLIFDFMALALRGVPERLIETFQYSACQEDGSRAGKPIQAEACGRDGGSPGSAGAGGVAGCSIFG
jgi:hypothetical protein